MREVDWERGPDGEAILSWVAVGRSYQVLLDCEDDMQPRLSVSVHEDGEMIYFDVIPVEWSVLAKSRIFLALEDAEEFEAVLENEREWPEKI